MTTIEKVLVPTDFSPYADYALDYARALVNPKSGEVHFVHVVPDQLNVPARGPEGAYLMGEALESVRAAINEHAEARLETFVLRAEGMGLKAQSHLLRGDPAEKIAELSSGLNPDLLIVATHGHSPFREWAMGGTCDRIVRLSPVPVLAIKHPEREFVAGLDPTVKLKKVLCPCDFSEFSHEAIPIAVDLCRRFDATLILEHIVDNRTDYSTFYPAYAVHISPQLLENSRKMLESIASKYDDLNVECRVNVGIPMPSLLETVDGEDISLVVMSTHGRSGIRRAFLGSVSERLIQKAACPVLTVRPEAYREQLESADSSNREAAVSTS
jgi:nucleotide-binding universal stress UspA family protein